MINCPAQGNIYNNSNIKPLSNRFVHRHGMRFYKRHYKGRLLIARNERTHLRNKLQRSKLGNTEAQPGQTRNYAGKGWRAVYSYVNVFRARLFDIAVGQFFFVPFSEYLKHIIHYFITREKLRGYTSGPPLPVAKGKQLE